MSTEEIIEMPFINNLIKETESKIKEMTGYPVSLIPTVQKDFNISTQKAFLRKLIEDFFCIEWETILKRSRRIDLVYARQFYVWICVKHYGRTLSEVGRDLGQDHATCINSISRLRESLNRNDTRGKRLNEFLEIFNKSVSETKLLKTA